MAKPDYLRVPATTEASAAIAQTRAESAEEKQTETASADRAGEGLAYTVGPGVSRAVHANPYERKAKDPLYRPLKIYTQDPALPRLQGAEALVNVPYEPLPDGPKGRVFEVDDYDAFRDVRYRRAELDSKELLIRDGLTPSPSDPRFHQQMVYAVSSLVYAVFRTALGRHIAWGFSDNGLDQRRATLRLRPHAGQDRNAYYDKRQGEICFGYFRADSSVAGRNLPGSYVFTCLSHDVIAHEVTHALLDGLRTQFDFPSGPGVMAFHEGFADLVAIFQHFTYRNVLQYAIRQSRGRLERSELLTDLARQFGHTTGSKGPLRSAIDVVDKRATPKVYDEDLEIHALGSVLVSAVFEAFATIFKHKTERYIRLATNGSGVLPLGELPVDLQNVLAAEAAQLASQFLAMCIRAIDYCPPVDLEFGEFLRAVITADYDLVPDDPWGYREAWIDAFRRRQIYPRDVPSLSEDALLWRQPMKAIECIPKLNFASLKFQGDPGRPAGTEELQRQACTLGQVITQPENLSMFGLAAPGDPRLNGDRITLPCVQSIRSSRRVGPDGQIVFDLVAEVTQRRFVRSRDGDPEFDFYGGSTVILGPEGEVRYTVAKSITNEARLERQRKFINRPGNGYWQQTAGRRVPVPELFKLLHL